MNDPELGETLRTAFGNELCNLMQGDKLTGAPSTDTIFFMDHDQIDKIPKDQTVTYAQIVVDF